MQHQRMGLAGRFIRATREIKIITPATPLEHPLQTMATLARSHRQVKALRPKCLKRLSHTRKQR